MPYQQRIDLLFCTTSPAEQQRHLSVNCQFWFIRTIDWMAIAIAIAISPFAPSWSSAEAVQRNNDGGWGCCCVVVGEKMIKF